MMVSTHHVLSGDPIRSRDDGCQAGQCVWEDGEAVVDSSGLDGLGHFGICRMDSPEELNRKEAWLQVGVAGM